MFMIDPYWYIGKLIEDPYSSAWIHWNTETWILHKNGKQIRVRGEIYTGEIAREHEVSFSKRSPKLEKIKLTSFLRQDKAAEGVEVLHFTMFSDETSPVTGDSNSKIHSVMMWCGSIPAQARVRGTSAATTLIAIFPTVSCSFRLFRSSPCLFRILKQGTLQTLTGFSDAHEKEDVLDLFKLKSRQKLFDRFSPLMNHGADFVDATGINRTVRITLSQLALDGLEA
jgi:hypothetical protein